MNLTSFYLCLGLIIEAVSGPHVTGSEAGRSSSTRARASSQNYAIYLWFDPPCCDQAEIGILADHHPYHHHHQSSRLSSHRSQPKHQYKGASQVLTQADNPEIELAIRQTITHVMMVDLCSDT
ncbi:hypothetical protein PGT21_031640, partial [Puccinia graminis f. sp. tritici]